MTGIEGLIFDLDHTLYSLAHANEGMFLRASVEAALELAREMGDTLTRTEAETLLQNAKEWQLADMQKLIRDRGYSEPRLFELFNRHAFGNVKPAMEKGLDPGLAAALAPWKGKAVIVTHSSRYWAEQAVKLLGLQDIFPPERIIALNDPAVAFQGKDKSTAAFDAALEILGLPADKTAMVEDTAKNLSIPHGMGMTTVLLTWGRPVASEDYPQVDRFHNTAGEFLRSLTPPAPQPGLSPS
jgi:putative hydrolase of the HAD superfamily